MSYYDKDVGPASREYAAIKDAARLEKQARARKLAAEGLTATAIAKRLGVTQTTVSKWLQAVGINTRRSGKHALLPEGCP